MTITSEEKLLIHKSLIARQVELCRMVRETRSAMKNLNLHEAVRNALAWQFEESRLELQKVTILINTIERKW